jgi:hypothetical protein
VSTVRGLQVNSRVGATAAASTCERLAFCDAAAVEGSDTRLEMQWPALCDAILRL